MIIDRCGDSVGGGEKAKRSEAPACGVGYILDRLQVTVPSPRAVKESKDAPKFRSRDFEFRSSAKRKIRTFFEAGDCRRSFCLEW